MAHPRFEMLRQVRRDDRLTKGAKLLYWELDDRAGKDGETWPKQETLAVDLNTTQPHIGEWMTELRAAGYLRIRRRQRASTVCILAWLNIPKRDNEKVLNIPKRDTSISGNGILSQSAPLYDPQKKNHEREEDDDDAPPKLETPEDLLLVGLYNRGLGDRPDIATEVVVILRAVPVPVDFFLDVLDRKVGRKVRLRQDFDPGWLPTVAHDAVKIWRNGRVASEWRSSRAAAAIA